MKVKLGDDYLNLANVTSVHFAADRNGRVKAEVETTLNGTLTFAGDEADRLREALELLALRAALPASADDAPEDYGWLEAAEAPAR